MPLHSSEFGLVQSSYPNASARLQERAVDRVIALRAIIAVAPAGIDPPATMAGTCCVCLTVSSRATIKSFSLGRPP
jgi:hypothetical protein